MGQRTVCPLSHFRVCFFPSPEMQASLPWRETLAEGRHQLVQRILNEKLQSSFLNHGQATIVASASFEVAASVEVTAFFCLSNLSSSILRLHIEHERILNEKLQGVVFCLPLRTRNIRCGAPRLTASSVPISQGMFSASSLWMRLSLSLPEDRIKARFVVPPLPLPVFAE